MKIYLAGSQEANSAKERWKFFRGYSGCVRRLISFYSIVSNKFEEERVCKVYFERKSEDISCNMVNR